MRESEGSWDRLLAGIGVLYLLLEKSLKNYQSIRKGTLILRDDIAFREGATG